MGLALRADDQLWWGGDAWDPLRHRRAGRAARAADAVPTAPAFRALIDTKHMWRLALPWHGNRPAPDHVPRRPAQRQRLLAELDLTGPFWQLWWIR